MPTVELSQVEIPDFGAPTVEPEIGAAEYQARIARAREIARDRGIDILLVYGDREHWSNLTFFTGYDPRFEESLLILGPSDPPILLVGNEGMGFSRKSPIPLDRRLYQQLSLMGQPRGGSKPLEKLLAEAGLRKGSEIGIIDWKYFTSEVGPDHERWLCTPDFMVRAIRSVTGKDPRNVTDIAMHPAHGLRCINSVDQLAAFEFNSTCTTRAMRRTLEAMRPGMTEYEAVEIAAWNGMPASCHPVLASGPRADWVGSPSMRRLQEGDPVLFSLSGWGSLCARAGFLVRDASGLPPLIRDYVEKLAAPYFGAVVEWYQAIGIGVPGGELARIIQTRLGDPFFGVSLNPGHLIHLDEWVHSPIAPGSAIPLASGMAIQVDIIPATGGPYFTSNIEDGIALADERLRAELASRWPEAWRRIQARRVFMKERLGISLKPEVLPFSSIPASLAPFLLSPRMLLRVR